MSSGAFTISKYQSTELGGAIMPIRLQEETLVFAAGSANEPPTTPVSIPLFVNVSANRNKYGVKPRKVTFEFTGAAPAGYTGDNLTVPVLTEAAYAAYIPGTTGSYLGAPIRIVSRTPEFAK